MSGDSNTDGTLGRIALKQVRVRRKDASSKSSAAKLGADGPSIKRARPRAVDKAPDNPLNRLVPYLDLFARLDDTELAKLSGVTIELAAQMRAQVDEVARALVHYIDLIDRLSEEELVRLTQAPPKTVRFWLLCQPRTKSATVQAAESGTYDTDELSQRPANDSPGAASSVSESGSGEVTRRAPAKAPKPPAESSGLSIEVDETEEDEFADFDPSTALVDDDDDDDDFF